MFEEISNNKEGVIHGCLKHAFDSSRNGRKKRAANKNKTVPSVPSESRERQSVQHVRT